jgi:hypothetical protein
MLRTAAAHRWLAGFLLFYGAFCVEEHRVGGLPRGVVLGALAVAIAAGNFAGTVAGSRLADVGSPRFAPVLLSVSAGVTIVTAVAFALVPLVVLAFASAAAAALAKLALDATIQHRTADSVRTSTFARSETTLQLAWVLGGAVGIVVPTRPALGFALAAAVLVAALAVAVRFARRPALPAPAPAASTR